MPRAPELSRSVPCAAFALGNEKARRSALAWFEICVMPQMGERGGIDGFGSIYGVGVPCARAIGGLVALDGESVK